MDGLNELKAALDLYAAQYSATDKLWGYFSTVTFGIVGFTVATDKVSRTRIEAACVVLCYLVFCFGNFAALILSQRQLLEFANLARRVTERHRQTFTVFQPLSTTEVAVFYWLVVSAVCAGILFIVHRRRKEALTPRPAVS